MEKYVDIDIEIEQDLLDKFEVIASKNNRSVEEEISNAINEGFAKIKNLK